jgi:hypothetical protein
MNDRVERGRKDVYCAAGHADTCQCAGVDSQRVVIQVDQRADIRRKFIPNPAATFQPSSNCRPVLPIGVVKPAPTLNANPDVS